MEDNTKFVKLCQSMTSGQMMTRKKITFNELFNLKYPIEAKKDPKWLFFWRDFTIYAKIKKDVKMSVWNGKHPVENNTEDHTCKADTKVLIWMVSRFGDIGITDNLKNPKGYDSRGIANRDLYDWEIYKN